MFSALLNSAKFEPNVDVVYTDCHIVAAIVWLATVVLLVTDATCHEEKPIVAMNRVLNKNSQLVSMIIRINPHRHRPYREGSGHSHPWTYVRRHETLPRISSSKYRPT